MTDLRDETERCWYSGEVKDGKPHGRGASFHENGKLRYNGEWIDGKQHGNGEEFGSDGLKRFTGQWVNGMKHGRLTGYWIDAQNKVAFLGTYVNDEANGKWIDYEIDGRTIRFEGEKQGDGGSFFSGHGKKYEKGKLVYEGRFEYGKPIKK